MCTLTNERNARLFIYAIKNTWNWIKFRKHIFVELYSYICAHLRTLHIWCVQSARACETMTMREKKSVTCKCAFNTCQAIIILNHNFRIMHEKLVSQLIINVSNLATPHRWHSLTQCHRMILQNFLSNSSCINLS